MRITDRKRKPVGAGNVLLLVAKSPVAGQVKTRLQIADSDAVRLASTFLEDTVSLVSHPLQPARVVLALDGDPAPLSSTLPPLPIVPQGDGNLGERLIRLFQEQFAVAGTRAVCAIGSDTPHLPLAFLVEAYSRLAAPDTDVVLGPADDGGYYLIGMNRFVPELFVNIPWSGPKVLQTTQDRAQSLGVRTALLPPWYDIDTPAELAKLRRDIARNTVTVVGTAAVV